MKITVTCHAFERAFIEAGRPNQFTQDGLNALFDYFEELENDCGVDYDLDVIAVCCQFSEYASIEDIIDAMGLSFDDDEMVEAMDWLQDHTTVIQFDTGIIIENY